MQTWVNMTYFLVPKSEKIQCNVVMLELVSAVLVHKRLLCKHTIPFELGLIYSTVFPREQLSFQETVPCSAFEIMKRNFRADLSTIMADLASN